MESESIQSRSESKSLLLTGIQLGVLLAALLGILWLCCGKIVAEKVASDLLQPVGLLSLGILGLALHALRQGQKITGLYLFLFVSLLCLLSNRHLAEMSVGTLEGRYAALNPLEEEPVDVLVLLGGATRQAPSGQTQVNYNGDRVVMAARLLHSGKAQRVVCTGARTKGLSKATTDEAEQAKILLVGLGIEENRIELLGGRNTFEEMQILRERLVDEQVGILTSAWHLPRAMRLAESAGLNARPIPADFIGNGPDIRQPWGSFIRDCVPNHEALFINARVLKEYLAYLVGR